jgi:hypothetical protein
VTSVAGRPGSNWSWRQKHTLPGPVAGAAAEQGRTLPRPHSSSYSRPGLRNVRSRKNGVETHS